MNIAGVYLWMKASHWLRPEPSQPLFKSFLIFSLCLPGNVVPGRPVFDWNKDITQAYRLILELRLDQAGRQLDQVRNAQPENLAVDFIEDYIDFFSLYISEDKGLLEKRKAGEAARLKSIETHGDPNSPYTRYALGEIHLHWGLVYLKFGSYLPAFQRIRRAYKLLEENNNLFPEFLPSLKSLGILHAMLGTLPDELKWMVRALGGINGTVQQGREELRKVYEYSRSNNYLFSEETMVLYGLIMAHFDNEPEAAWQMVRQSGIDPQKSPLACFVLASLAIKCGYNEQAVDLLEKQPSGPEYFPLQYLDYMLGLAKLRRLDPDADLPLKKFSREFKGLHYLKECFQKLAWFELIRGNETGYYQYMERVRQVGNNAVEEDKQATREARLKRKPDPLLLQARLLYDGGYLDRAQAMLEKNQALLINQKELRLETAYRLARIYQAQKKFTAAISHYLNVIQEGREDPSYYACAAALYTGMIYETLHHHFLARHYYEQCLAMNPEDYRSGLHQKAKAGIGRIGQ